MFPCQRYTLPPLDRRAFLRQAGCGFGAVALAALWQQREIGGAEAAKDPLAPRQPHFRPRAKSVIYLYMDGGPSQVDTFDPKPRLNKEDGQPFAMEIEPTQFNNNGNTFGCPWAFRQYGESGLPVSDLFPHIGACADEAERAAGTSLPLVVVPPGVDVARFHPLDDDARLAARTRPRRPCG